MSNFSKLKARIKKNEGFKNYLYNDQLGNLTIGFGHLVRKKDNFITKKKYSKRCLNLVFEKDFKEALKDFKNEYQKNQMPRKFQEVLIEMTFQLGIKNLLKFKRFNKFLMKNKPYLASLEMLDSQWYNQTPKRVESLIEIMLNQKNVK